MKSLRLMFAALAAVCLTSVFAFAGDPSGTWKWTVPGRDGQTRDVTLKLQLKDGQLTGSMSGFRGDTPISSAVFKDDHLSFVLVREFRDRKFEQKFDGKLDQDTIKGTIKFTNRDGEETTRDWSATREK